MRNRPSIAILVSIAVWQLSTAADWRSIKPNRSTEQELVAAFGPPDEVVATFPWNEWSARWKVRPVTRTYRLRYRSDLRKSPLLAGPGGSADEVNVDIWDRKIVSVVWRYTGDSGVAAAQMLRADPELKFNATESPCYAAKGLPNGRVYVEIAKGNSPVVVVYDLK
jgi:hypothetical protein